MSRRAFRVVLFALATAAPGSAHAGDLSGCGSPKNLFQGRVCSPEPSATWQIDFGKTKLPPVPEQQRLTHEGWRPVTPGQSLRSMRRPSFAPSAPGFQSAFVRGLNIIPALVEKTPIDCAMARPGDPAIDPSMVRQVHGHVQHSIVIVPVARCR